MVSNPRFFDVVAEEYVSLQKDAEGPVDRSPNSRAKKNGDSQVIFYLGMSKRLVVPQCLVGKHCCMGYLKHIKMSKPKRNPFCSGWFKFSSKFISYLTPGCLYQRFFFDPLPSQDALGQLENCSQMSWSLCRHSGCEHGYFKNIGEFKQQIWRKSVSLNWYSIWWRT